MPVKTQQGFSLIELMVVVVIAAILVGLGMPSLRSTMNRNAIGSEANRLVRSLNFARSQAVNKQQTVTLQHKSATVGDWSDGWIMFTDSAGDGLTAFDPVNDTLIQDSDITTERLSVNDLASVDGFISFEPSGRLNEAAAIQVAVCDAIPRSNRVDGSLITISLVGRTTVTTIAATAKTAATCGP